MDEATYKAWWPLHIRRAQGKTLTREEQTTYEAGRREMEAKIAGVLSDEGLSGICCAARPGL